MPIFEYKCSNCDTKFEELVSSSTATVICPQCKSDAVEKLLSTFAASSSSQSSGGAPSCGGGGCGSGFG